MCPCPLQRFVRRQLTRPLQGELPVLRREAIYWISIGRARCYRNQVDPSRRSARPQFGTRAGGGGIRSDVRNSKAQPVPAKEEDLRLALLVVRAMNARSARTAPTSAPMRMTKRAFSDTCTAQFAWTDLGDHDATLQAMTTLRQIPRRRVRCRLTAEFSGGTPAFQDAGAHRSGALLVRPPAAEHFMRPRPLQRFVRRLHWDAFLDMPQPTPVKDERSPPTRRERRQRLRLRQQRGWY